MEFLISFRNTQGVTLGDSVTKVAPAHLPQNGDTVEFRDEDGKVVKARVQSRSFSYVGAPDGRREMEQVILTVTLD